MTNKQAGLGDNLYVHGYDLSSDVGALSAIHGGPAALEVTGINKSGIERVGGLLDGGIEFDCFWDVQTDQAHDRLSALPTTDVILTYTRGTTRGAHAAGLIGKQVNYDPVRAADGALTAKVQAISNAHGIEWGVLMTAGMEVMGAADGDKATVDFGAAEGSTQFGGSMYVHVNAIASGSVTAKIQDSTTGAGGSWVDVPQLTTGAIAAAGAVRVQTTSKTEQIDRYCHLTLTGPFTGLSIAVVLVKHVVKTATTAGTF